MTSSAPYVRFDDGSNYSDDLQLELGLFQKEIKVYNIDGTCQSVLASPQSSADQIICTLLSTNERLRYGPYGPYGPVCWAIVEVWKDEGIERILENHESVLECYHRMEHEENRMLVLQISKQMFEMFDCQDGYFLYKSVDINQKTRNKIIRKILNGDMDPLYFGHVWIYDCNKIEPSWDALVLLLKEKVLYLSSSHQHVHNFLQKNGNNFFFRSSIMNSLQNTTPHLRIWAYLRDFKVYKANKRLKGAPTDNCLCLVAACGLQQYIACTNKTSLTYWMCAMRLSKYGKQLRDNYRSFVKKHNDANEYEYNKKPVPNESVRSHVAMDFSGNVGRIVEDPKEALAIAQAETGNVRRSWRSSGRTTPGLQAAVTKLENDIHLSQPWYHKNMSRDQAANVLNGLGNKDGVFLIRESKSKCGSFVLTFKCGGKIVHTPIIAQMDSINDLVCFTLDNGVTKFYDLLQLVEFYQLNAGSLPTRLMHYVVQVPVTK